MFLELQVNSNLYKQLMRILQRRWIYFYLSNDNPVEFVFRLQIPFNRHDSTDLLSAFISRKNNVILWETFVEIVVAEKIDTP